MPLPLDKLTVIRLAACHECCAMRGERCQFTRAEDPRNLRAVANQSHLTRIKLARKKFADMNKNPLDNLVLTL